MKFSSNWRVFLTDMRTSCAGSSSLISRDSHSHS